MSEWPEKLEAEPSPFGKGEWDIGNQMRVIATVNNAGGLLPPKETEANAAELVRRWNCHEELVGACEEGKKRIAFLLRKIVDAKTYPVIDGIEIRKTASCISFIEAVLAMAAKE